jgi:hypothetical protein
VARVFGYKRGVMGIRVRDGGGAAPSRPPAGAIALGIALGVVALAASLASCSADLSPEPLPPPPLDGSTFDDVATHADASVADATVSDASVFDEIAADAPVGAHARLVLVNGSPNAPALRFCFGTGDPSAGGTELAAAPALPDDDIASAANGLPYPGVFAGAGAPAADPQADWSRSAVAFYAINAERIRSQVRSQDAAQANCRALLGPDGGGALLTMNQDYWYLGAVPPGSMADGTAWLTAIVGCLPGVADSGPPCDGALDGSTPPSTMGGGLWQLDNTTAVDAGSEDAFGAQFVNASFALAGPAGKGVAASAGVYTGDAAALDSRVPVSPDAIPGALRPATLAEVSGVAFDADSGFYFEATLPDGGVLDVTSSFPAMQKSTWGVSVPEGGAFEYGRGFVFVLVGDPSVPDPGGAGSTRAGRLLAFPTNPPFGSP